MKNLFGLLLCLSFLSAGPESRAESEAQLIEKAKKEGTLQLSSNKLLYSDLLIEAFTKKYPFIKVRHDLFNAAGQPGYDIFEASDPADRTDVVLRCQDMDLRKWKKMGWLAPLDDLPNWKQRPKHLEDDSHYVYFVGSPHVIAYNPEKIAEADLPKTYDELLSPKWKGQLVMRSPLGGNSPAFFVQFIEQKHGGLDWFRKFGANIPMIADNGPAVHEIIQNGKRPLALSRDVEVISYNAKTKGKKLKYFFIQDDLPYQYQAALMNSKAPHQASSRLFLNWLFSAEAQEILEKNGFSVGENQAVALKHKSTFQWNLTKGRDFDHYRSTLFQAKRNLKSGGADTYMLTEQQQKEKALANESIGD